MDMPTTARPLHALDGRDGRQTVERARGSAAKRGYGRRWRRESKAHLRANPLCVDCEAEGKVTAATVVDHEKPHRGDMVLFWDRSNWRSRCKTHHDRKTATHDGGFGNPLGEGGSKTLQPELP